MLEKLIEILAALIASIDRNTAALSKAPPIVVSSSVPGYDIHGNAIPEKPAAKTKTPKEKPAEPPAEPVYPTVEELRTIATELLDLDVNNDQKTTCPPIKALKEKYGVKKISDVTPDKRAEVIVALKTAIAEFKAKPKQTEEV